MTQKNKKILIPVFKPLIEREDILSAVSSLERGWLGMGSDVKKFEESISKICKFVPADDRRVIAVNTGHSALHLSLLAIGVGVGDEVITPSFNNVADLQAIKACGAEPVFVDIEEATLCIDPKKVEQVISNKTKCIIVMDYDVYLCDHSAFAEISRRTGIPVLHDAAHSFGSSYKGRPIGNQHKYTMFSFDPVKSITCIDGGAIIVQGEDLMKRLQAMRLIGMTQPAAVMYENSRVWEYDVQELGFRYHMPNLHAAIGVIQINKIDKIRKTRQETCDKYFNELSKFSWISAPKCRPDILPFLYYIRILNKQRDQLRKYLREKGVDTGIHWQPGHTFSYFKDCKKGSLSVTNKIYEEIMSLPLHSCMSERDLDLIIESIKSFNVR